MKIPFLALNSQLSDQQYLMHFTSEMNIGVAIFRIVVIIVVIGTTFYQCHRLFFNTCKCITYIFIH